MVVEYIRAIMNDDPASGRELMKLNSKQIANELGVTEEELLTGKKSQKNNGGKNV